MSRSLHRMLLSDHSISSDARYLMYMTEVLLCMLIASNATMLLWTSCVSRRGQSIINCLHRGSQKQDQHKKIYLLMWVQKRTEELALYPALPMNELALDSGFHLLSLMLLASSNISVKAWPETSTYLLLGGYCSEALPAIPKVK